MADDNKDVELSDDQKQENKGKDQKKFEEAMSFLRAVVGGEENLRPKKKVKGDQAAELVAQLFHEEKKELQDSFRASLKELLKKFLEMEAEFVKEQKKLDDLKSKKQKEFTQAVNNWKNKVEQSDIMNAKYTDILTSAFGKERE